MRLIKYRDSDNSECGRVATIGVFDGVHMGHRYLINKVKLIAKAKGLCSTIITFDKEPKSVLDPNHVQRSLSLLSEKIKLLCTTGIDATVILEFDRNLANMCAKEFLRDILLKKLNVKVLIIGYDHRFGHNREEGFEHYVEYGRELGVEVIKSENFYTDRVERISSSDIRTELKRGNVERAYEMLSYRYSFSGKVISGQKIGRTIGFPTANIKLSENKKLIPGVGVYAVNVLLNGRELKGMMNIGYRPTISNINNKSIEVNILDFDEDIYGEYLTVECIKKVRDEIKFHSIKELINQLYKDREIVELILNSELNKSS